MKPLLLSLSLFLAISCKKTEPASSASTGKSQTAPSSPAATSPPPTTPTPAAPSGERIPLVYDISYEEMKKRTERPPDEPDPFASTEKYPSKQLAEAGLPLPKGASIAHTGSRLFLNAPSAYHEKVAVLLGVTGTPPSAEPKDHDNSDSDAPDGEGDRGH